MIFFISNSDVSVARNLPISLRDRRRNGVGVKIAARLSVNQANSITIPDKLQWSFGVIVGFVAVGVEKPIVVCILVVITSDLLLAGALRERLNVRVKKAAAVSHVLNRGPRSNGDLKRAILADFRTLQVSLKQRAHLGISRAAVLENQEVEVERKHVDENRDDY